MVLSVVQRDSHFATEKARQSGHKKRCAECRHVFTSKRSDAKYCSQACRQKAARKRSKPDRRRRHVATCSHCHEPFVSAAATSLYCSQACRQGAYRQRREQAIAELQRLAESQGFSGLRVRQEVQRWSYSRLTTALERAKLKN